MATLANIYAKFGENTVLRFQDDTQDLSAFNIRAYANDEQIGEAPGVAAGEALSIPVYTADLTASGVYVLTVYKVSSGGVETAITLDRTYNLKITPEE